MTIAAPEAIALAGQAQQQRQAKKQERQQRQQRPRQQSQFQPVQGTKDTQAPQRMPASPPAAAPRAPGPARQSPRRKSGPGAPRPLNVSGKGSGGILLAEYIAGALIIATSILTKGASKGYLDTMSQILLRLTALTFIFFALFLAAASPKAGRAAVWFGLLIDLGILFTAVSESQISTLASIIKGEPTGVDQTTLTAATTVAEPVPDALPS